MSKRTKRRAKLLREQYKLRGYWRQPKRERPAKVAAAPDDARQRVKGFYKSWEWKQARYLFLKTHELRCECCGASKESGAQIVVDHIKSIRRNWNLRFDQSNLQALCNDCNMGKGSTDETDWRVFDPGQLTPPAGDWLN